MENDARPLATCAERLPFVCLAAITPAFLFLPITHDAIWQIWIGRQILHGAVLYKDIIEVNPPLWFWIAIPLAAIGDAVGIGSRLLLIGFFLAAICVSLLLVPPKYRLLLLLVMIALPLHDFAQREHFTLISTTPYVLLIATRVAGRTPRHPFLIGLFAAIGFALKPHFIIVPLALEILVWSSPRVRPETVALTLSAIVYLSSIFLFAPQYVRDTIPLARQMYGAFRGVPNFTVLLSAFAIAGCGVFLGRRTGSSDTRTMALASIAFVPAVLIQNKGFDYHSVPARGLLFFALALELSRCRRQPVADAFLVAAMALCALPLGVYRNPLRDEVNEHLAGVAPGTSIIVLAGSPLAAWPMVDERRLEWRLRELNLWQLAALSEGVPVEVQLKQLVAEDLAKRPSILIIERRPIIYTLVPDGYLGLYRPKQTTARFDSYVLKPLSAS